MPIDWGETVPPVDWEPPFMILHQVAGLIEWLTGETVKKYSTEGLPQISLETERPDPPKTGAVVGDYHAAELLSIIGEQG